MSTILGIIIVLYIICKIGAAGGEKKNEDASFDEEIQNEEKHLSDEEILEISSKILQYPYISTIAKTARELTSEILQSPIKAEKLVDTLVMMEDYIEKIYIKDQMICIILGNGDRIFKTGYENQYVRNKYKCEIVDFYRTIENLKVGDRIKVIGVLNRESRVVDYPNCLEKAIVIKINYEFVPEVEEFLRSQI